MPTSTLLGAVGELAASRHGAFTRRQAADIGITHQAISRLRDRGVLLEPAPGVLVIAGMPSTYAQRVYVATLANGGSGLAIGDSAGRLHSLDGMEAATTIDIAVPRGGRLHLPGVRAWQVRGRYGHLDVTLVDGIPCSTLARTVCDLAWCHPTAYERAADDFQRRGHSLAWMQQTMERTPRRRGDGLDRVAADIQRRRSGGRVRESWFEQLVECCLTSRRLPPLVRQHDVHDHRGSLVGRVDLAFPSLRLAVEAHSRTFHTGPRREAFDQRRENELAVVGWDTAYVGWADATGTPAQVCRTIERIAARRATDLQLDLRALLAASRSRTVRMPDGAAS